MTASDEQYVPSDEDMEERYVRHSLALVDFPRGDRPEWEQKLREEFRRGLARVRRDAAREAEARIEAVQHLIDQADEMGEWAITCTRLQWAIDGSAPQPGA